MKRYALKGGGNSGGTGREANLGWIMFVPFVCCTFGSSASAGPVLLASFDFAVDTEMQAGNRVGFVLQLLDVDNDLGFLGPPLGGISSDVRLGPAVFWDDGETGVLEFTSSINPEFDAFASLVSDGIDDSLIVFWQWEEDGGFGGNGALESQMFGLDPDLIGNVLELVRLTVHEVSLDPVGEDMVAIRTRVTYDFLGSPIPEPGTLVLLMVVSPLLMRGAGTRPRNYR